MYSILKEHQHKTKFGKLLHILVHIILYIWQLPQNLAGLGYKIILRGEKRILKQRGTAFEWRSKFRKLYLPIREVRIKRTSI